jgi:dihydroflavonol-4-reductase
MLTVISACPKSTICVIIGGLGYLGQHLLHDLLGSTQNHSSILTLKVIDKAPDLSQHHLMYPDDFTHPNVHVFLNTDMNDERALAEIFTDADVVFCLAAVIAYGRKHKASLYQVNAEAITCVVDQCIKAKVKKLIHVSSFATLGCLDSPDKTQLTTENCKNNLDQEPFAYYAISKYAGEQIILNGAKRPGLKTIVAIPGILIGPGFCSPPSLLPFEIATQKKWTLVPQGGCNYIDVRDVALGLIAMMQYTGYENKFLLTSYNIEHKELLQLIARLSKNTLRATEILRAWSPLFSGIGALLEFILPRRSTIAKEGINKAFKYRYYSNRKAALELNWQPKFTLDETITDAIQFLKQHELLTL